MFNLHIYEKHQAIFEAWKLQAHTCHHLQSSVDDRRHFDDQGNRVVSEFRSQFSPKAQLAAVIVLSLLGYDCIWALEMKMQIQPLADIKSCKPQLSDLNKFKYTFLYAPTKWPSGKMYSCSPCTPEKRNPISSTVPGGLVDTRLIIFQKFPAGNLGQLSSN